MADGESRQVTRCGSVRLRVLSGGVETTVRITGVFLDLCLVKNIVSYGKLEWKCFALAYDGKRCTLTRRSDGAINFDVAMESNVLYVQDTTATRQCGAHDSIMETLEAEDATDVAGMRKKKLCCISTSASAISRSTRSGAWQKSQHRIFGLRPATVAQRAYSVWREIRRETRSSRTAE
uniref:Uncharacterized protein n=1 Tax=Peronospora matthiolae TaxID=2874970 RepID=A0AAV1TRN2_9STRA